MTITRSKISKIIIAVIGIIVVGVVIYLVKTGKIKPKADVLVGSSGGYNISGIVYYNGNPDWRFDGEILLMEIQSPPSGCIVGLPAEYIGQTLRGSINNSFYEVSGVSPARCYDAIIFDTDQDQYKITSQTVSPLTVLNTTATASTENDFYDFTVDPGPIATSGLNGVKDDFMPPVVTSANFPQSYTDKLNFTIAVSDNNTPVGYINYAVCYWRKAGTTVYSNSFVASPDQTKPGSFLVKDVTVSAKSDIQIFCSATDLNQNKGYLNNATIDKPLTIKYGKATKTTSKTPKTRKGKK